MRRRSLIACAAALLSAPAAYEARAGTCLRPTDEGGAHGYAYGAATARSFVNERVVVWYVTTGPHAVRAASARADGVPDDVADAAAVTSDALARYAAMGFRAPITDANTACGSNGGDARLDVYLVRMVGADGVTFVEPDRCDAVGAATRCAAYLVAQADFTGAYPTTGIGIRTVLPHEVFHAVQDAYDAGLDRFWAEGTAQWAAATLDPSLNDLERFLPAFFSQTSRSLDASPNGVTASFLYGAAIWPVFLTQRHGDAIVRAVLEGEGAAGGPALVATDAALRARQSSLAQEFTTFSSWNAGAGLAAAGGYLHGERYPAVTVTPLPAAGTVQGITSGLAALFYRAREGSGRLLSLTTNGTRNAGTLVPIRDGVVHIDASLPLPPGSDIPISGDAIVVINGITTDKTDAPFMLTVAVSDGGAAVPDASKARDGGSATPDGSVEERPTDAASSGDSGRARPASGGGCAIGGRPSHDGLSFVGVGLLAITRRAPRRKRRGALLI